jgi:hypothetical protein
MAANLEEQRSKFIATEPLGVDGESSEKIIWDAVRNTFKDRNCLSYWRYPIFSKSGKHRKEPDVLIVDRELGLIIIEVKGLTIDQIKGIDGHRWEFKDFYDYPHENPYQQAENQLYALLGYCDNEPTIHHKVTGRTLVALPRISEKQWQKRGFDRLPSCPPLIFRDHLDKERLLELIIVIRISSYSIY